MHGDESETQIRTITASGGNQSFRNSGRQVVDVSASCDGRVIPIHMGCMVMHQGHSLHLSVHSPSITAITLDQELSPNIASWHRRVLFQVFQGVCAVLHKRTDVELPLSHSSVLAPLFGASLSE